MPKWWSTNWSHIIACVRSHNEIRKKMLQSRNLSFIYVLYVDCWCMFHFWWTECLLLRKCDCILRWLWVGGYNAMTATFCKCQYCMITIKTVLYANIFIFFGGGEQLWFSFTQTCQISVPAEIGRVSQLFCWGIAPHNMEVSSYSTSTSTKNISEFWSFLGLLNYYSKFIVSLSNLIFPLNHLLKADSLWW